MSHVESGKMYKDEGYVQLYEVSTKALSAAQDIYVTIWAVNGVSNSFMSLSSLLPSIIIVVTRSSSSLLPF